MWWYRVAAGVACATVALFALAGSALAGGWAVTTIDALPEGGFQAGTSYRLGYMIRQHGQMPFDGAKTSIRINSATTGESRVFPGSPDGPAGHYVAEVTFPSEGEWSWEVSQYPFASQTLGTVTVAPQAFAGPVSGVTQSFALLVLAVFVGSLSGLVRRRRGASMLLGPQIVRTAE